MTDHEIRLLILERLRVVSGSCNSTHLTHNDGVFRGLLWAMTGRDPGTRLLEDVGRILEAASIPFERVGEEVRWTYDEPGVVEDDGA